MSVTAPTIHLNGSSAATLLQDYEIALSATRRAIECLQDAAPNARDYYVQGDTAFAHARREHEARLHRLADTCRELMAIVESIESQVDARKARRAP